MSDAQPATSNPELERRQVRFGSLEGIDRSMIPLACDVWLADLSAARWATLEMLKLGTAITRFMIESRAAENLVSRAESDYQLSRDDVMRCLYVMRSYGAVSSFTVEPRPQVSLALNGLQRLKVLEAAAGTRKHLLELGLAKPSPLHRRCRMRGMVRPAVAAATLPQSIR